MVLFGGGFEIEGGGVGAAILGWRGVALLAIEAVVAGVASIEAAAAAAASGCVHSALGVGVPGMVLKG